MSQNSLTETEKSEIIERIKTEFLYLVEKRREGYFITLEQIYNWLGNPEIYEKYRNDFDFRNNFNKNKLKENSGLVAAENEDDLSAHYIMRREGKKLFPIFSIDGLKTFYMLSKEPRARFVRMYYIQLEKDYMALINKTAEEAEQEKIALYKQFDELKKELKDTKWENDQNNKHLDEKTKEINKLLYDKVYTDAKLKTFGNMAAVLNTDNDFGDNERPEGKELIYLRERFGKKINIYIVRPDYVEKSKKPSSKKKEKKFDRVVYPYESDYEEYLAYKEATTAKASKAKKEPKANKLPKEPKAEKQKKAKESEPDDKIDRDTLEYSKPFDEYINYQIQVSDYYRQEEVLYFAIGSYSEAKLKSEETYNHVGHIYVVDKEHYTEIKHVLDTDMMHGMYTYKTVKNGIYKINYSGIMDIRYRYLCRKVKESVAHLFVRD